MDFGTSTANFYPDFDTEVTCQLYGEASIKHVEIFLNTFYETREDYLKELKETLDIHNIKCNSVHFMSSMMEPPLFDLHKRRRNDYMDIFKDNLKAVKLLGSNIYTFHGATNYFFESYKIDHMVDCYKRIYNLAYENDVLLAQENVSYLASGKLEFYKILKEKLDIPMKYTLDIKQARRNNIPYIDFLDIMGEDLVNLHLSDCDDMHNCLVPGDGSFNFNQLFETLEKIGYKGKGILEVYRENFKTLDDIVEGLDYLKRIK